ncbi:MAG: hypothetical protein JWO27_2918 [Frankiales bacterium]|nr:hypothetical protein [Frankiales bacterium]
MSTHPLRRLVPRALDEMMRVVVVDWVRVAFGQYLWGGAFLPIPIAPGSVVYSEKVLCRSEEGIAFVVWDPFYVREPAGTTTQWSVVGGTRTHEHVLDPDEVETLEVWTGAVGIIDRTGST